MRSLILLPTFALLACGPVIGPARFHAPEVPRMRTPTPPAVAVPRWQVGSVADLVPTPVAEDAAAPRPLPDLTGRGLGLALGGDGAAGGSSAAGRALARRVAVRLLRAGYTRALDVQALRPVTATLADRGRTLVGSLDRMLLLERFPRVDLVLFAEEHRSWQREIRLTPPVADAEAALARYREEVGRHRAAVAAAVGPLDRAISRFRDQCGGALADFDAEAARARDPALREQNAASRAEAATYCEGGVASLTRQRQLVPDALPPEQAEAQLAAARQPVKTTATFVRLSVTLFDTHTGETLWAATFARRDVGEQEATAAIVDHLAGRLLANTRGLAAPSTQPAAPHAATVDRPGEPHRAPVARGHR